MYLGLLICLFAIAVYLGYTLNLLILPVFVTYMNEFQIKPEEDVMEQKFGDEFSEYKKEVRRWI
jgi:protein-S-isoprenylcysteine O-methyltransferase Ste14